MINGLQFLDTLALVNFAAQLNNMDFFQYQATNDDLLDEMKITNQKLDRMIELLEKLTG